MLLTSVQGVVVTHGLVHAYVSCYAAKPVNKIRVEQTKIILGKKSWFVLQLNHFPISFTMLHKQLWWSVISQMDGVERPTLVCLNQHNQQEEKAQHALSPTWSYQFYHIP